jgi:hypothetical protein
MKEFMKNRADLSGLPSDFLTSTRARRNQLVLTPDQAAIQTTPNFKYKEVEKIFAAHPELRDKIGGLPQGISDTKALLDIAAKGADGAEWYEMWRNAIAAHTKGGEDARAATMIFALLGKAAPVDQNYANFLRVMGRGDHGFMGKNETDTQTFIDSRLGKMLGQTQQTPKTFSQAFRGEVPSEDEIRKLLDYMMSFLGADGAAIDEWMNRMFVGARNEDDTSPSERNYDAIYGRIRHLTMMANAKKLAGKSNWTIWQMQAALWVGYRREVANYLRNLTEMAGDDPKIAASLNELNNLADTLTTGATPEKIMGQFGMGMEGGKATPRPKLNVHEIMGKKLEQLIDAAGTFRLRDIQNLNIVKNPEVIQGLASQIPGQIDVLPPDKRSKTWRVRAERGEMKELQALVDQHNANAASEDDRAELAHKDTMSYKGRDMENPMWLHEGGSDKLDKLMKQDGLGNDLATLGRIRDTSYNVPGEEYWKDIGPNAEYMAQRAKQQGYAPSDENPKLLLSATLAEIARVVTAMMRLSDDLDRQGRHALASVFTDQAAALARTVTAQKAAPLTSGDARRVLAAVGAMSNAPRKVHVKIRN